MQVLGYVNLNGRVTVTVSYAIHTPFGPSTEQNSFELTPEEVAALNGDFSDANIFTAAEAHLKAAGFVELAP